MTTRQSIAEKFEALKSSMSKDAYEVHIQKDEEEFKADPDAYIKHLEKAREEADKEDNQNLQP